jgi:UDP-N-acetylglucosamine 2-epimerase (non-hydrolysing)
MLVLGTRPQIIKSAPIIHALKLARGFNLRIIHTGQHYDYEMSKVFFGELRLPNPDANLDVGSGTHAWQTAEMMKRLEEVIARERPDCVLVPGDTNSTLAGALVAAKLAVPVAHLEAGARSFNMTMPEEINRVLTDHLSSLLFAPTKNCAANLGKEGIPRSRIRVTGDTHFDAFCSHVDQIAGQNLSAFDVGMPFAYVTVHRAENVDDEWNLKQILHGLLRLKGLRIVFAAHPRTKTQIKRMGMLRKLKASGSISIQRPVTYLQSLALAWNSSVVVTDSGGLQREAFWLRRPCVVLRATTEWPETLNARRTVLASPNAGQIVRKVRDLIRSDMKRPKRMLPPRDRKNAFGDGHASEKVLQELRQFLSIR